MSWLTTSTAMLSGGLPTPFLISDLWFVFLTAPKPWAEAGRALPVPTLDRALDRWEVVTRLLELLSTMGVTGHSLTLNFLCHSALWDTSAVPHRQLLFALLVLLLYQQHILPHGHSPPFPCTTSTEQCRFDQFHWNTTSSLVTSNGGSLFRVFVSCLLINY